MIQLISDKTFLNLISLLLSGSGIFSLLSQFYVPKAPPESRMSYWGSNPFIIKQNHQEIIKRTTDKLFFLMTFLGTLIQALSIIYSPVLKENQFRVIQYWLFFIVGLIVIVSVVIALSKLGVYLARRKWIPETVNNQREVFKQAKYILDNGGWREDQINQKSQITNPEEYRAINFGKAKEWIEQIEKLLEIKANGPDLKIRAKNLEKYFIE